MRWSVVLCVLVWLRFAFGAPLNIHVIAHTHDDVGWLKTVDEYYYGARNDIQRAGVQYVLDSVIPALLDNPNRRFIYIEIAFFIRWWNEQNDEMKQTVRDLVKNGQFEFINGGWSMNDEACAHYEDTITQMSRGHDFLLQEFGVRPTIGWQIDPFGHSNAQATMFSQMGFSGVFFARIDYQDYQVRTKARTLEMIWKPSPSLGSSTDIFTHVFWGTTYCYPPGFDFEDNDPPIQDDPRLFDLNVAERAQEFVSQMNQRAAVYRTSEILVTFGCDFGFSNANINFKNMDKLMAYINNNKTFNMNVKYSTPSIYLKAVHDLNLKWPVKSDDFFPYADGPHAYWTGYFTSRSAQKGYIRSRSNILHATDKLLTTAGLSGDKSALLAQIDKLTQALSVNQHHDAVTGTEKEHVRDDYEKRLYIGTENAENVINTVVGKLVAKGGAPPSFTFCHYLNESVCPQTNVLSQGQTVVLVLYNPLPYLRVEPVRLPIPKVAVTVSTGSGVIPSQSFQNEDFSNLNTLVFQVKLPPMGFDTVFVQPGSGKSAPQYPLFDAADSYLENEYFQVNFSTTNLVNTVYQKSLKKFMGLQQNFFWYNSSIGNQTDGQPSGAYIFRPNSSTPFIVDGDPSISFQKGTVVQQATQVFANWLKQTIRLYAGQPYIEFESTIGPIPFADGLGKEVITSFQTSLNTANTWYTDQQSLEYIKRVLNYRPSWNLTVTEPVAGNYYPVDVGAYIKDPNFGVHFGVLNDRARSAASLRNGELELMLHRRILHDDYRGVGEPLNESTIIRTRQHVVISDPNSGTYFQRSSGELVNHPVIIGFGPPQSSPNNYKSKYALQFSPLAASLPPNIQLTHLKTKTNGQVVLRLHHLFGVNENTDFSKPVTINLSTLFNNLKPTNVTETQLTANQPLSAVNRYTWQTQAPDTNSYNNMKSTLERTPRGDFVVTLNPMETRTYWVTFASTQQ